MLSSEDMTWGTPQDFFDKLDEEFNFTLDPCATPDTAKCKTFFTKEEDGLSKDWTIYKQIWINPPFTRKHDFIKKACETYQKANNHTPIF